MSTKLVKNAIGRMVPTVINGKPAIPFKGVGKFRPEGGKHMFSIEPSPLPDNALLRKYVHSGAYTDCYRAEVPGTVTHAQYVIGFSGVLNFHEMLMLYKN